jgi:hypothetical protein
MEVLRRAGVVLILAVLALGLGGAVAGAKHKKKGHAWGSKITLQHPSAQKFKGTVKSSFPACRQGRLVKVFYTDPSGSSALLSVQRTNRKGRYEVDLTQPAFSGEYRAQAAHERIRAQKAPQTCKKANSKTVRF